MAQTVYRPLKRALWSLSVLAMLKVAIKQLPNPGSAIESDGTRVRGRFCLIVERFRQRLDQKQTKKSRKRASRPNRQCLDIPFVFILHSLHDGCSLPSRSAASVRSSGR
jgi:hypothetical protein